MTTETRTTTEPIDEEKLNDLLETALVDCGATAHATLAVIGDKLGLFAALADAGPLTSSELAEETEHPFAAKHLPAETRIEMRSKPNHADRIALEKPSMPHRLSNITQRLWERRWQS